MENLWNIPKIDNIKVKAPDEILKEFAAALKHETNELLLGRVDINPETLSDKERLYNLDIYPIHYRNDFFRLFTVRQNVKKTKLNIYPVTLVVYYENVFGPQESIYRFDDIKTAEELKEQISLLVKSDKVRNIIEELLIFANNKKTIENKK